MRKKITVYVCLIIIEKNRNMNFINSESNSMMAATAAAFENILQTVQSSNLNFLLEMSPFAANISLKTTPVKTKSGIPLLPYVPNHSHSSVDDEALVTKNLELENELLKMKNDYVDTIDNSETARKFMSQIEIKTDPDINKKLQKGKILVDQINDEVARLVN